MRRKKVQYIAILLTIVIVLFSAVYLDYRQEISNITIVTDICGKGENFRYTYLRVIISKESYHGYRTLFAIYWKIRFARGRQNWTEIIVYDNWDRLRENNNYVNYRFDSK